MARGTSWGIAVSGALIAMPIPASAKPKIPHPSYQPARDRNIEVEVSEVLMTGDKGYLPKDRNWVQLRLLVRNRRNDVVTLSEIKARQASGVALASATVSTQLAKPPDLGKTIGKGAGLAAAGQVAGYLIFPPLALVGSAAGLVSVIGGNGSWRKRMERIDETMLNAGDIAPDTATEGTIYIPATVTQSALIVMYRVGGRSQTLSIPQTANLRATPTAANE
ncbi:hypothetical protein WG908_03280 [Sphingobium sp. AN641]|uniref:hypothetical protein n=1 Tax=Sphingobium sp. AN641 TaxID=3133443 RepID=UPI0030BFF98D